MTYRHISKRSGKRGLPAGSLVYVGAQPAQPSHATAVVFDEHTYLERVVTSAADVRECMAQGKYVWLNIDGLENTDFIREVGELFGIHALALEDMLNAEQRPKREDFDDFLLVVAKSITWEKTARTIAYEQISFILGAQFILSVQEKAGDPFTRVRQRLQQGTTKLRKVGPDYLMYVMLDLIVDDYFLVLEHLGEELDLLEDDIVTTPHNTSLARLYDLKRSTLYLRRSVWPLREALGFLQYGESKLIKRSTLPFLRDVHSHALEALDAVEIFRELLSSMLDVYLSSASNRMNSVIKVLTVITTIFMPLTLIAGIYGMNFHVMPELEWRYGYPFALGLMLLVTIGMLGMLRAKRWL